eukprot:GHVP01013389.1.p1 GENE.GHVP01013389.1~~GHVP01013389.1.p1  ORF type:complete len:132 (+),score=19.58 GHVP01013389.1:209-604(+)
MLNPYKPLAFDIAMEELLKNYDVGWKYDFYGFTKKDSCRETILPDFIGMTSGENETSGSIFFIYRGDCEPTTMMFTSFDSASDEGGILAKVIKKHLPELLNHEKAPPKFVEFNAPKASVEGSDTATSGSDA